MCFQKKITFFIVLVKRNKKLGTEISKTEQRSGQKETSDHQIRAVYVRTKEKILKLQKGYEL